MDTSNVWLGLALGGFASCAAEVVTLPVDVIKIRLQLQGQGGQSGVYKGTLDAAVKIGRAEGLSALWKGLMPALLRQSTYGSMRYGFYTPIKRILGVKDSTPKSEVPLMKRILAGAGSGALASAICNPTDLIKIRMQADGMFPGPDGKIAPPRYRSLFHAFSDIIKTEGVTALWRGVGPTCGRATILAAAELATYDEVKSFILEKGWLQEGLGLHVSTALVAGIVATFVSSPFDVVKSRVMNQPINADGSGKLYSGMVDCFRKSVTAEGPLSLWKGFVPNFARVGPRVLIVFIVMEQLKALFYS